MALKMIITKIDRVSKRFIKKNNLNQLNLDQIK